MLPIIGCMIGLYVVVRAAEMYKNNGKAMKISCFILIIVESFFMLLLMGRGANE